MQCDITKSQIKQGLENKVMEIAKTDPTYVRISDTTFSSSFRAVDAVNDAFKRDDIVVNKGGHYEIHVPEDLVNTYYFQSNNPLTESEITNILFSDFGKNSPNLLNEDLWQHAPLLQKPTIEKLINFVLKINPNFNISIVEGLSETAIANIAEFTIKLKNREAITELPEEVAHFFIELLEDDNPLKISLINNINNFQIYRDTYEKLKNNPNYTLNGQPDIQKIKKEAAAKLIAAYINGIYDARVKPPLTEKQQSFISSLIDRIFKFLREAFFLNADPVFYEHVLDEPFLAATERILSGNVNELTKQVIPNGYDEIFYSTFSQNLAEVHNYREAVIELNKIKNKTEQLFRDTLLHKINSDPKLVPLKNHIDKNPQIKSNMMQLYSILDTSSAYFRSILSLESDKGIKDMSNFYSALNDLVQALVIIQEYPKAIESTVADMEKNGVLGAVANSHDSLLAFNSIIQTILDHSANFNTTLSDARTRISKYNEYASTLSSEDSTVVVPEQLDKLLDSLQGEILSSVGHTERIQNKVSRALQTYIADTLDDFTEESSKLDENLQGFLDGTKKLRSKRGREYVERKLTASLNSKENLRRVFLGMNLSAEEKKRLKSGIIDVKLGDYMKFFVTSATLVTDPFVTAVYEKYLTNMLRAQSQTEIDRNEMKVRVLKLREELAKKYGLNVYEIDKFLYRGENFTSKIRGTIKKRVLLGHIKYHQMFSDLNELEVKEVEINKKIAALHSSSDVDKNTKIDELREERRKISEQIYKIRKEEDLFESTDEFRRLNEEIFPSDPESVKKSRELAEINLKISEKLDQIDSNIMSSTATTTDDVIYSELAELEEQRITLLGDKAEDFYEKLNNLYELDEERSLAAIERYKNNLYRKIRDESIKNNTRVLSREVFEGFFYTEYMVTRPSQAFYDDRNKSHDEISAIYGRKQEDYFDKEIEEISKRISEIRKTYKTSRGEIDIFTLKNRFKDYSGDYGLLGRQSVLTELKALFVARQDLYRKKEVYSRFPIQGKNSQLKAFLDIAAIYDGITNKLPPDMYAKKLDLYTTMTDQEKMDFYLSLEDGLTGKAKDIFKRTAKPEVRGMFMGDIPMLDLAFGPFENLQKFINSVSKSINPSITDEQLLQANAIYDYIAKMSVKKPTFEYKLEFSKFQDIFRRMMNEDDANLRINGNHITDLKVFYGEAYRLSNELDIINFKPESIENILKHGLMDTVLSYARTIGESKFADSFEELHYDVEVVQVDQVSGLAGKVTTSKILPVFLTEVPVKKEHIDTARTEIPNKFKRYKRRSVTADGKTILKKPLITVDGEELNEDRTLKRENMVGIDPADYSKELARLDKLKEDVLSGKVLPTVTMDGYTYIPSKKSSAYYDKEYDALLSATDEKSKAIVKYLTEYKRLYYELQRRNLTPERYMDDELPVALKDSYELKTDLRASVKKAANFFRGQKKSGGVEETENLDLTTVANMSARTGLDMVEDMPRLRTKRMAAMETTSNDMILALDNFIEDSNEFQGKHDALPFAQAMLDSLRIVNKIDPDFHKRRIKMIESIINQKFLGKVTEDTANNPELAKIAKSAASLVSLKLFGDPIGAIQNLLGGLSQNLIEASLSKKEMKAFMKVSGAAARWGAVYNLEGTRHGHFAKETQLSNIFNFMPENLSLAKMANSRSWMASVRNTLMKPRTITEIHLGMQLGLSILREDKVSVNGKEVYIDDLYELDKDGRIDLKSEYKKDQDFVKKYDLVNGTEVLRLKKKIFQKYVLIQGNYAKYNKAQLEHSAWGDLLLLFKGWFGSNVARRTDGPTFDRYSQEVRGGHMNLFVSAIWRLGESLVTGGNLDFYKDWRDTVGFDSKLLKKSGQKLTAEILILVVLWHLIKALGFDEDDKDRYKKLEDYGYWKNFALLSLMRSYGEVGTYIPLPMYNLGFNELQRATNVTGLIQSSVIGNTSKVLWDLSRLLGYSMGQVKEKDVFYTRVAGPRHLWFGIPFKDKGDSKLFASAMKLLGANGTSTDPAQAIKVFQQVQNRH